MLEWKRSIMQSSVGAEYWQRFWTYSHKLVLENLEFMTAFFVMNIVSLGWQFWRAYEYISLLCYGFSMFLATFLLLHLIELIRWQTGRKIVRAAMLIICGVVFLLEIYTIYTYDALLGAGILNALAETNRHEVREYIIRYFDFYEMAFGLVSVGLVYWIGRFCLELGRKKISKRHLQLLSLFGLSGTVMLAVFQLGIFTEAYFPLQRTGSAAQITMKNIRAYQELSSQLQGNVIIKRNNSHIKNVVLVIGESCNRNHMGLYGYYLPNTPYLSRLQAEKQLYTFTDVISPHSTTVAALSKLLTFCNYESLQDWYTYNNLIDVVKAAGYKTFWLSNQESSGIWGSVAQLFAQRSDVHRFTRIRDSQEDYGVLDEELLPLLDQAVNERAEKNFFVIHLMGQHDLYYNRYPYTFHKFTADDIRLNLHEKGRLTVAHYDNSILYNDFILAQIIDRFQQEEALLLYVSDHGEAIYDGNDFNGHVEENPNRHMIEIPCMIWASPSFGQNMPDKLLRIAGAVERPYMTDDMIHTLLDLMEIETVEFEPQRSLVNPGYDASRRRIYNGINYDTQIRQGLPALSQGEK